MARWPAAWRSVLPIVDPKSVTPAATLVSDGVAAPRPERPVAPARAMSVPRALLVEMRPRQWTKNLIVFAPLLFSLNLGKLGEAVDALLAFVLLAVALPGATLQKLSFEEMVSKATAIVRAKIGPATGRQHGALVYSHHKISILETWKGNLGTSADVVVPGGQVGRLQQTVAGAPILPAGDELVLFLWTSPSGLTHVIGLSQGVFQLERDAAGAPPFVSVTLLVRL